MERWAECVSARPQGAAAAKALGDMPGPSVASFAWDLFAKRGLSRLHELQLEGVRRYGPVWKASFGPILTVHVADPALIEQVLRQEGQHPMRSDLSSWKDYRRLRGHHCGLLTSEGEEWQSVRSLLGKHMLRPKAVEAYDQTLNSVVEDLIAKLRLRRSSEGLVTDIASEFYRFGLEGVSSVLFESRIGCLDETVPEETERFIQSINTMFVMTLLTMAMPRWMHQLFPKPWNVFCQCWDYMFDFAKGHIDQRMAAEAEKVARGEKVEGRYLTYFLSQTDLPMKTVYSNVTELLLAGVDTISSTLSWSLYELSRHRAVQASLREEVLSVLGGRRVPTAADVAQMPLLKATVKEVLRLYPVIPANARVIAERDIQVGGYLIPKNVSVSGKACVPLRRADLGADDGHFPLCLHADAHHPLPLCNLAGPGRVSPAGQIPAAALAEQGAEPPPVRLRALRGGQAQLHRAAYSGAGALPRRCQGEFGMQILMEFDIKPDPEGISVKPMTRTLLVPENVINLQFTER
ncbi:unnamed protein product [Tetraodon nigroviridis]|uniref:(spotted green pufferfish) hypothetical protein n=1 Tax=Tetraodon nigroviridis TaxID=99883 RepID=Q4RIM7_TETNG|nr:unnamed protein product [Tetraodon nigroviridis]